MDRIWQLKISKLSIAETYTIITGEVIQCPETGYFDNESVPCELMSAGRILMELQVSDIWVEPQNDDNEFLFFTEHLIPESFQSYIDEGLFLCSLLEPKSVSIKVKRYLPN